MSDGAPKPTTPHGLSTSRPAPHEEVLADARFYRDIVAADREFRSAAERIARGEVSSAGFSFVAGGRRIDVRLDGRTS